MDHREYMFVARQRNKSKLEGMNLWNIEMHFGECVQNHPNGKCAMQILLVFSYWDFVTSSNWS
jgi:hypothetical protein